MKVLSIAAVGLLCALSSSFGLTAERDARIIGGSEAKQHHFSYMVSIRFRGRHLCGGAIISPKWVISGLGYFEHVKERLTVVAGEHHLYDDDHPNVQEIKVKKIHNPHNYESGLPYNDIALLELYAPFTFNDAIQPVTLPKDTEERTGDMVLSGWGLINRESWEFARTLQYIEMPSITNEECNSIHANSTEPHAFDFLVKDTMLCTLPSENQTACYGDYAGPLVQNEVLVGILISDDFLCKKGLPHVYTKVSAFRYFIDWRMTHPDE